MEGRYRLTRFDAFSVVSLLVTTILFFPGGLSDARLYAEIDEITAGRRVIGCIGWLLATLGPILFCASVWRLSKHLRRPWLAHIVFLPVAHGLFKGGDRMMLYATGETDWDGVIGGPILQAMFLYMLAVVGYYFAAVWTAAAEWRSQAHVR
jgi:hypothetical protein